jgi:hypothetical protein
VALADGSVKFVKETIHLGTWRALGPATWAKSSARTRSRPRLLDRRSYCRGGFSNPPYDLPTPPSMWM